jgi:hypothetical protein
VAAIDLFANQLLEEAKRFLEKADEASEEMGKTASLHAALMLAFCALEAHVNSIGEEFSLGTVLSVHEKGLLLERDVRLEDGEFSLKDNLKIYKLEDRIQFLHARFSGKPIDMSTGSWAKLMAATQLRNQLTHAKTIPTVTETAVKNAIDAIIQTLDALYKAIYKKPFPPAAQGLQSSLDF